MRGWCDRAVNQGAFPWKAVDLGAVPLRRCVFYSYACLNSGVSPSPWACGWHREAGPRFGPVSLTFFFFFWSRLVKLNHLNKSNRFAFLILSLGVICHLGLKSHH